MSSRALANQMVQVSTDAKARPTITAFTTMSAAMNMPHGERSRGSLRAKSGEFEAWAVTGESPAGATAGAGAGLVTGDRTQAARAGAAAGFVAGVAGAGCGAVGDGDVAPGAVCARTGTGRIRTAATTATTMVWDLGQLKIIEFTVLSAFQS